MRFVVFIGILAMSFGIGGQGYAQNLHGVARFIPQDTTIEENWRGDLEIKLALSQPIPFKISHRERPHRIVMDFREVDWTAFDPAEFVAQDEILDIRSGRFRPRWSRLVIALSKPMHATDVELDTSARDGQAVLSLRLKDIDPVTFSTLAGVPDSPDWRLEPISPKQRPKLRPKGDRPLKIVIDPGHGGIDSGAVYDGYKEKDIVLSFARLLKDTLISSGRYQAELTRNDDNFLALPQRIAQAHHLDADVFVSLHADAVLEGYASGTTIYTLSDEASDEAAEKLAIQLDRADLLSGVDLIEKDDELAGILMDLARIETNARSEVLAETMVKGIGDAVGQQRKRPHLSASFSVLRSPDIPSVLIELGFLNNPKDLARLLNDDWRAKVAHGILDAFDAWSIEDAAQADLLRK